jgi:extradiol dioxygenase
MIDSLNYLGFTTPNIDDWRAFGPSVIGLQLVDDWQDGSIRFRMDGAGFRIAIHPGEQDEWSYVGWGVAGPKEFAEAAEKVTAAGYEVTVGTSGLAEDRGVAELFSFTDTFGARHEITWGQVAAQTPFRPGRGHEGFVTGQGGLGHVALITPSIPESEKLYVDVLNFELTDEIHYVESDLLLRFYHCNSRHHSVALIQVPERAGIHHVMLETNSIDDVGRALDRAEDGEAELARHLGRHVNDEMVSIYLKSPSQFQIEYGCYARVLHDESDLPKVYRKGSIWGHRFTDAASLSGGLTREVSKAFSS